MGFDWDYSTMKYYWILNTQQDEAWFKRRILHVPNTIRISFERIQ